MAGDWLVLAGWSWLAGTGWPVLAGWTAKGAANVRRSAPQRAFSIGRRTIVDVLRNHSSVSARISDVHLLHCRNGVGRLRTVLRTVLLPNMAAGA